MKHFLLLLLIVPVINICGADRYWVASSNSNWNNTANWSTTSGGSGGASVPGSADKAIFDGGGSGTCTFDINVVLDAMDISSGTINTSSYTLTINGSSASSFSGGSISGTGNISIQPAAGTAVHFSGTNISNDIDVTADEIYLDGSTFGGISSFNQTGSTNTVSTGGNTFTGNVTIKNTGSAIFKLGNGTADICNNDLLIYNTGAGDIYFASLGAGHHIYGNCYIHHNSVYSGSLSRYQRTYFLYGNSGTTLTIDGNLNVDNSPSDPSGSAYTLSYIYLAYNGSLTVGGSTDIVNSNEAKTTYTILTNNLNSTCTLNGPVTLASNSSSISSKIYCSNGKLYLNDNVILESALPQTQNNGGSDGISLGGSSGGEVYLAAGKSITISSNGFKSGQLTFYNMNMAGSYNFNFSWVPTLGIYTSTFNGNLTASCLRYNFTRSTFNGDVNIATGNNDDFVNSGGGNTFNGNVSISYSGTVNCVLGSTYDNDYNGDLSLTNSGTGNFYPFGQNATTTYIAGNVTFNFNTAQTIPYNSGALIVFDGNSSTVTNNGANFQITNMKIDKNSSGSVLTFNTPLTITGDLDLTSGIIQNASTISLTSTASVSNASASSFIDGPCQKSGNTDFVFPVGDIENTGSNKIMAYAPVGISNINSISTASYTVFYHKSPYSDVTNVSSPLTKVSQREYWEITRGLSSGSADITLHFPDGNRSGISNLTDLRVAHYNTGTSTWENLGQDQTTGNATSGSITVIGVSNFSPFAFGSVNNSNNLPVELLSFEAQQVDAGVLLSWSTASEINSDFFTIERSENLRDVREIAKIAAAGNSNVMREYNYTDNQPIDKITYYRLTETDLDGSKKIYPWKSVENNMPETVDFSILPNPSTDGIVNLNLNGFKSKITILIFDISGTKVYEYSLNKKDNKAKYITLKTGLSQGVYLIRISDGRKLIAKKLVMN